MLVININIASTYATGKEHRAGVNLVRVKPKIFAYNIYKILQGSNIT